MIRDDKSCVWAQAEGMKAWEVRWAVEEEGGVKVTLIALSVTTARETRSPGMIQVVLSWQNLSRVNTVAVTFPDAERTAPWPAVRPHSSPDPTAYTPALNKAPSSLHLPPFKRRLTRLFVMFSLLSLSRVILRGCVLKKQVEWLLFKQVHVYYD